MALLKVHQSPSGGSGEFGTPVPEVQMPPDDKASAGPGTTGTQAGIFARAVKEANTALPILDKLRVLSGDSTPRDVNALKTLVRSEFAELVGELALANGPSAERVEQIFSLLLDQLGALQEGIEDEENLTNFRIVADCVASLYRSWNNVQQVFGAQTGIVLQQFKLVSDAVEEVRFAMDAVSIAQADRKGMIITRGSRAEDPHPFSIEELLDWVHDFATCDGPATIEERGGFALRDFVLPTAKKFAGMAAAATEARNRAHFAKRYNSPALQRAMKSLEARLDELAWNC